MNLFASWITTIFLQYQFISRTTVYSLNLPLGGGHQDDRFIIGILSKCEARPEYQRLAMAKMMSSKLKTILQDGENFKDLKDSYQYYEIDVCEDEGLLIKVLDSLLLEPQWMDSRSEELKVKAIFAFVPERLLKAAASILSFTSVKLFPLYTVILENQQWFERFPNMFPIVEVIGENIVVDLIRRFEWKHVAIFDVVNDIIPLKLRQNQEKPFKLDRIQKELPERCFDYGIIKLSSLVNHKNGSLFKILKNDQTIKAVVVKGQLSALFMRTAAMSYGVDKNWVLMTKYRGQNEKDNPEFISIFDNLGNEKKGLNYQKISYQNDTVCNPNFPLKKNTTNNCSTAEITKYQKIHFEYIHTLISKQVEVFDHLEKRKNFKHKAIFYQYHGNYSYEVNSVKDLRVTKKIFKLGDGECRECQSCKDQCQSTQIRIVESHAGFSRTISRGCSKCKPNSILSRTFGTCSKCPEPTISNHNQSVCYHPIIHEKIFIACYIINTLGLCICIFIGLVYYRRRETPVVRSSDFTLSMIQLILCAMLFVVLPVISSSHLSGVICTLRPCILSPLLVAIVSIVVCKAEKILIIFYTRRRLTQKNIKDIYIRQGVILAFLLVIDMIILPATFPLPSTVKMLAYPKQGTEDLFLMEYCSNDEHFDFQIVYCIGLLLLAILQGYRGRKLPRNYNEGNSIIVSASAAICGFAFKIWVTTTDQHQYERTSTAWLSLSVSVLFIILPLYGPKVYIMLFLPHKNTKKHLMNRMLYESAMKKSVLTSSNGGEDSFPASIKKNQESLKSLLNNHNERTDNKDKRMSNTEHIEMSFI